jgi:hypothetical protein
MHKNPKPNLALKRRNLVANDTYNYFKELIISPYKGFRETFSLSHWASNPYNLVNK